MPLEDDDALHLNAAEGYYALRMYADADRELDNIDPYARHTPEVLKLRAQIYEDLKRWELLEVVAKRLSEYEPTSARWPLLWAIAKDLSGSPQEAKAVLVAALERMPNNIMLNYKLACIECKLGEIEAAKQRLRKVFAWKPDLRLIALDDEDLRPVWDSLGK